LVKFIIFLGIILETVQIRRRGQASFGASACSRFISRWIISPPSWQTTRIGFHMRCERLGGDFVFGAPAKHHFVGLFSARTRHYEYYV